MKVEQRSQVADSAPHRWVVGWNIHNLGDEPLQLLAAQCPHGRFRGDRKELVDFPKLTPGGAAHLKLSVACNEAPETVVENAFLILQANWRDQIWRILIRLTVTFDEVGGPQGKTEFISTQRVGFSSVLGDRQEPQG